MSEAGLNQFQPGPAAWIFDAAVAQAGHWYAVHIRSNFEKRVASELVNRNVECFLPVFQEIHRWKDRKKLVELPLFPGYVFTRFSDSSQRRLTVLRVPGVVRILGQGEEIEPVPDLEISSIQRLVASRVPLRSHPLLREGAWVKVKRGPLEGLEGMLLRVKNETRLVMSMSLLSQSVSTEVDISDVTVVRPAACGSR